jgi:hypothetical protein
MAANSIFKSLDVFNKRKVSLEDTFSFVNPTELRHYRVTCVTLLSRIKY